MKYIFLRQIWRECMTPIGLKGREIFMDPRARAGGGRLKESHVIHAKETRNTYDNSAQVWSSALMGRAQTIIAKLPAVNRAWGEFAYSPIFKASDHLMIREYLYRKWWKTHKEAGLACSFQKMGTLLLCFDAALEGVKRTHMTDGDGPTKADIARQIGVDRQNLTRDGWMRRFNEMGQIIDDVDRRALGPLSVLLEKEGCQ